MKPDKMFENVSKFITEFAVEYREYQLDPIEQYPSKLIAVLNLKDIEMVSVELLTTGECDLMAITVPRGELIYTETTLINETDWRTRIETFYWIALRSLVNVEEYVLSQVYVDLIWKNKVGRFKML
jgi:hypothetical protein